VDLTGTGTAQDVYISGCKLEAAVTASSFDPLFGAYGDSAREYYFDLQTNFLRYTDNTGTEKVTLGWTPGGGGGGNDILEFVNDDGHFKLKTENATTGEHNYIDIKRDGMDFITTGTNRAAQFTGVRAADWATPHLPVARRGGILRCLL
jgi:hypothetical protein